MGGDIWVTFINESNIGFQKVNPGAETELKGTIFKGILIWSKKGIMFFIQF